MANSSTRKRVYRQTITLMRKNFLIFYRAPISTIIRALVFPIVFTVVICVLKDVNAISLSQDPDHRGVIAPSPIPIQDLKAAIDASSSNKLVFVQNGQSDRDESSRVFATRLKKLT
jgi:ATP-binding cassette subfamily A (ABC1) protein 3